MAKDPAFLFYSSDFLTGTAFMSAEQVGHYIRLICYQHQHGHLSHEQMVKACGCEDEEIFSKFDKDSDGLYFNQRLEMEISKRNNYTESRRRNICKRYEHTYVPTYVPTYVDTYEVHMENENENKDEKVLKTLNPNGDFEIFWKAYPKKRGKGAARRIWAKIRPGEELRNQIISSIEKHKETPEWTKDGGQFIPMPATWLNQTRWEDEVEVEVVSEKKWWEKKGVQNGVR